MASNPPPEQSRRRGLIPFFRRRVDRVAAPAPAPAPSLAPSSGLAVRPPWWRMAVRRMVGGLWPGFRAGQSEHTPAAEPTYTPVRQPLLARRRPLAAKDPLTAKDSVLPKRPAAQPPAISTPAPLTAAPTAASVAHIATGSLPVGGGHAVSVAAQALSSEAAATPETMASPAADTLVSGSTSSSRPNHSRGLAKPPSLPSVQRSVVTAKPQTPEQKWRAAVAARPLEAPRAFPTHMRPIVAQLAGSADGVSYTAGPATQAALSEVGALGATTGRTVHLSEAPSVIPGAMNQAAMGVLAHELTHARSPITRPRFMLHDHLGSMDTDERNARNVGNQFAAPPSMSSGPPIAVQRLFGGGLDGLTSRASNALGGLGSQAGGLADRASGVVGGLADRAGGAVGGLAGQATGVVGGLADRASGAVGGLADRASGAVGGLTNQAGAYMGGLANRATGAVSGLAGQATDALGSGVGQLSSAAGDIGQRFTSGVGDLGNRVADQAGAVSAGLVDQLPVGGGAASTVGALTQVARSVVENAVRDASETTMAEASNAVGQVTQAAQGAASDLQNMASGMVNDAAGQANQWVNGAMSQASGMAQGVSDQVSGAVAGAENMVNNGINAVQSGVSGLVGQAAGALGPGALPQISGPDLDRIAEALEERLLRQLERRGGRYAGVF